MAVEDEFEEMRKTINRMLKDAFEGKLGVFREPFVYGFTARSRDSARAAEGGQKAIEGQEVVARDPLTDVILTEDALYVTADLPGIQEEGLSTRIEGRRLIVEADGERRYYSAVDLPHDVDSASIESTFRNGVLDIAIRRRRGGRAE